MATFSSVTREHILRAIAEYDDRGGDDFLGVYGFTPSDEYPLRHEGRSYESAAILGVAHRYATGRLATADEVRNGMPGAVEVLRRRGFEVGRPAAAVPVAAASSATTTSGRRRAPAAGAGSRAAGPRVSKARTARSRAADDQPPAICPTCSMALPATGICDNCA